MTLIDPRRSSLDWHYVGVSPQLLARVRLNWSALGLDLDLTWRAAIQTMPGFREIDALPDATDSRPIDLLLLFDQGCCWVNSLHAVAQMLRIPDGASGRLSSQQVDGLVAITTRLCDELAAVRTLAISGLAMPAMQISRSISEDVDLALALLVRRSLAQAFVECRSPEDAAEFWRRHVAGGRAFKLVAQALYRYGLDYTEDSDYMRWRKEVLVFLGSAVHTSSLGKGGEGAAHGGCLNAAAQECLYFATIRVQEFCAYSLVVGREFQAMLGDLLPGDELSRNRLGFVRSGGDIIIDQMRWLTGVREGDAPRRPALFS